MQTPTAQDFTAILPALVLFSASMGLLLLGLVIPARRRSAIVGSLSILTLGAVIVVSAIRWDDPISGFDGAVTLDNYSLFLNSIFAVVGILTILLSIHYLPDQMIERFEYYPLLLLSIGGMTLMGSASDFVILFIALEILSIPLYVLAGFARPEPKSEESSLKYFLLGAFASAFLIYGIAMIYGGTGTTTFQQIVEGASSGDTALTAIGAGLILVGLAFKVAAVPFHMWTPDVYEGAPTPITGFLSVGAKAAGFAALGRVLLLTLPSFGDDWVPIVAVLAALTMILGNMAAIAQKNIKRMLAYSSIAHAGFVLIGVAARSERGLTGMLFYLLAYAFTNLGAFAVLSVMARPQAESFDFEEYSGLAKRQPAVAAAMTLFMLSLTGIPPTVGFVGKYYLFWAAVEADLALLAVLGVVMSVVSAFFYLRVVVAMYFSDPLKERPALLYPTLAIALVVTAAGTLLIGLWPEPFLQYARDSVWPILTQLSSL